jgi:hypothetical protein
MYPRNRAVRGDLQVMVPVPLGATTEWEKEVPARFLLARLLLLSTRINWQSI